MGEALDPAEALTQANLWSRWNVNGHNSTCRLINKTSMVVSSSIAISARKTAMHVDLSSVVDGDGR